MGFVALAAGEEGSGIQGFGVLKVPGRVEKRRL